MDIEHKRGGDMTVALDQADLDSIRAQGFCMDRNGLVGRETKTWIREDRLVDHPIARIDLASDVYVHLKNGASDLPVRIEQAHMDPYLDHDRSRISHHFGEAGAIVVKIANS